MAVLPFVPMDEFLSKQPPVIQEWIEQDLGWKLEEVQSLLIGEDVSRYVSNALIVTIEGITENGRETKKQDFIQWIDGTWRKA